VPCCGTPMVQEPFAVDFAVPVKSPPLAVMVTPARGARVSSRRKPLMLFWKVWFDGDGVGAGEAAWDAGAATRRIARMEALRAPNSLSNRPRLPAGWPWGVLLKLKTSTWGRSRLRLCSRCERSQDGDGTHWPGTHHDCEFRHPAWLMLQRKRRLKCCGSGLVGSDRITTACARAPRQAAAPGKPLLNKGASLRGTSGPGRPPGTGRTSRLGCTAVRPGTFSGASAWKLVA
jgi:hypothetical protein